MKNTTDTHWQETAQENAPEQEPETETATKTKTKTKTKKKKAKTSDKRSHLLFTLKEYVLLTLGASMTALGIYFFKFPNHFSTGGVSGLSVILNGIFPQITPGTFVMVINVTLLLLGFLIVGRDFTVKTVYCSLLMSVLTYLLEKVVPMSKPLTGQPMLELVFAILLPAVGSAILFNAGASTGGTDIVAMTIKKYSHVNISVALFCSDFLIVMATVLVFGMEAWLFSLLGFLSKVFVVNNVLEGINMSKYCTVVTSAAYEEEICTFITEKLHKSATYSETFKSAYRHEDKVVLLAALTRRQARELKAFLRSIDKESFVIISNSSDICGKGFREVI